MIQGNIPVYLPEKALNELDVLLNSKMNFKFNNNCCDCSYRFNLFKSKKRNESYN